MRSSLLRFRRMGDGGVLFDEQTWETHILNQPAAAVFDALLEDFADRPIAAIETRHLLEDELGFDPNSPNTLKLLSMLQRLGLVV